MELKKYQQTALDRLKEYLKLLEKFGPKMAFMSITEQPYKSDFFGEVPFICVKIPTGGGKTVVAAHSVASIYASILKNKMDRGVVMWFVPSDAIKTQTINKLKDRKDWHRQILDEVFENGVKIFSNEEALRIRKEDIEDSLCIIVSSLDAFRKEKNLQNKYKVYQENGNLLTHFEYVKDDSMLEKDDSGVIVSLANVIRLSNPLVVIDEGHRTQTQLSIDFLKDLNPSFIVEYTATPRDKSNILIDIPASDLKIEHMVKIPIVLESSNHWEQTLIRGLDKREELEKAAKKNKAEYIRPIALIQAQPKSEKGNTITVEHVKEELLKMKIKEEEIAIKISGKDELESVNLFSSKCPIKYIITVNALAEGWDCSFAYVLISLANIGSKISVEQIIGRVIRMPYAKRKNVEDLNRSYVFASARNFNEAADEIIKGLVSNGYSKSDLINGAEKEQKDPKEISRTFDEDFTVPIMALNNDPLTFEELVSADFSLAKQNAQFDLEVHFDNDGRAVIDIEGDHWKQGQQQALNIPYRIKNASQKELVQWLDKKLRFTILEQSDKVQFLDKAIAYQLQTRTLTELSINRYVLCDKLSEIIEDVLASYAKKQFDALMKKKKVTVKLFKAFPETIFIDQEIPQEFNKTYYSKIEKLNKEELNFVRRLDLDTLPNVKFWVRNREKKDPFFLQGWRRNKFYPDFIALTKKGNIIALEWKGEDRVTNADTKYKEELGEVWASLGKGKLYFHLTHTGNEEEVLNQIKLL